MPELDEQGLWSVQAEAIRNTEESLRLDRPRAQVLDRSKVRGSGGTVLTEIVSLVRYTLQQDDELVPFRDLAGQRFAASLEVALPPRNQDIDEASTKVM